MYPTAFREAALRVYSFFGSLRKAASVLGVSVASLSRWVHRLASIHRPSVALKMTPAVKNSISEFMAADTCLSAVNVVQHVKEHFGIQISRQLAHTVVRKLGYTYKRTRKRGHSLRVQAALPLFLQQYLSVTGPLVAVDESGFDQRATPVYGYAPAGQHAIVKFRPCSDRRRWSLLMAISSEGSHTYTLDHGSVKGEAFASFIATLPYPSGTTLLLDNASIHKTKRVAQAAADKGFAFLFTPPYCPEFNPIELVFGVVKQAFYKMRYSSQFPTGASIRPAVVLAVAAGASLRGVAGSFRHVRKLVVEATAGLSST
jgi:transposase